jgi:hypothetical protein
MKILLKTYQTMQLMKDGDTHSVNSTHICALVPGWRCIYFSEFLYRDETFPFCRKIGQRMDTLKSR